MWKIAYFGKTPAHCEVTMHIQPKGYIGDSNIGSTTEMKGYTNNNIAIKHKQAPFTIDEKLYRFVV